MQVRLKVNWTLTYLASGAPLPRSPGIAFVPSPNTGYFRDFSVEDRYALVPSYLRPSVTFYQVLCNRFQAMVGRRLATLKPPYLIQSTHLGVDVTFSGVKIREFLPGVLSATVSVDAGVVKFDPLKLICLQNIRSEPELWAIVESAVAISHSLDHRHLESGFRVIDTPEIHIEPEGSRQEIAEFIRTELKPLIGVLIRNPDYDWMGPDIPELIIQKNRQLNLKDQSKQILMDKQGLLFVANNQAMASQNRESKRPRELMEFGSFMSVLLDNVARFSVLREEVVEFVLYKVGPWLERPEAVLSSSVSNQKTWDLVSSELKLKEKYAMVRPAIEDRLDTIGPQFGALDEWWNETCLDSVLKKAIAEGSGLDLGVFSDPELKSLITLDLAEAEHCFRTGNYKASIILAGSVAEAILLAKHQNLGITRVSDGTKSIAVGRAGLAALTQSAQSIGIVTDASLIKLLVLSDNYFCRSTTIRIAGLA